MDFYTDSQRKLQDAFESRSLADAVKTAIVTDELNDAHIPFIASRDFFFLSTVNEHGEPTVSYKGGAPGTVTVVDTKTLVFPAYDGNGMFLSFGNIVDTAKIGLLFIDFETPNRVRVQATATFHREDPLLGEYPGAIGIVRAHVDKVFQNCARYIHKHQRTAASPYVPDEQGEQPYATWKRIDILQDHLQPRDRGRAEQAGGTITEEDYINALMRGES
ncbi:MAG: pyridoxamine 5'-phosphate oxidase family protein [Pseudomonadota bacterium]|nr:pyridoxamine 5'-phosphate oxidase family protein [Pseudomonadota bacterium]